MTSYNILSKGGCRQTTYFNVACSMVRNGVKAQRRKDLLKANKFTTRFMVGHCPADGVFKDDLPPEYRELFDHTHLMLNLKCRPLLLLLMRKLFHGQLEDLLYLDESQTIPVNSACLIQETLLSDLGILSDASEGSPTKKTPAILFHFFDIDGYTVVGFKIESNGGLTPTLCHGTHAKSSNSDIELSGNLHFECSAPIPRKAGDLSEPSWDDFVHAAVGYSFRLQEISNLPEVFQRLVLYKNEFDFFRNRLSSSDFEEQKNVFASDLMMEVKEAELEIKELFEKNPEAQREARSMNGSEILSRMYKMLWDRDFSPNLDSWYPLVVSSALVLNKLPQ